MNLQYSVVSCRLAMQVKFQSTLAAVNSILMNVCESGGRGGVRLVCGGLGLAEPLQRLLLLQRQLLG